MKNAFLVMALLFAGYASADKDGAPVVVTPPAAGSCARPAGNTGTGLYTGCGRVNNPDATEFRIRGVNRTHTDQGAASGMNLAGANTVRTFYPYQYLALPLFTSDMQAQRAVKIVNVATPFYSSTNAPTCNPAPAILQANVSKILADATVWKTAEILNIANEWGPADSTVWRDSYVSAISQLRAAGFTQPLMIDSGQCGQDPNDILNYGAAVAASDPQKNIILSFHLYGGTPDRTTMGTYFRKFAALAKANPNLAVVVGEFGPGPLPSNPTTGVGPSPTLITAAQVIADAEANNLGWLAWAWDDNNLNDCKSDDNFFSMTTYCAQYTGKPTELTKFGADIVGHLVVLKPARAKLF